MEEITTQYKPVLAVKRDRHYKCKYQQAKTAVITLLVLFVLMALVMAWTLRGNLALQQRLNDKSVTIIMPNKTIAHSK